MVTIDTTYFTDTVSYDNSTPYQLVNYFSCLKMDERKRGNYSIEEVSKVIESKAK